MVNFDYLYNPDAAKPFFNKNHLIDKKLSFRVIEKGMILPHKNFPPRGLGGIVDSNGEFIKESYLHYGIGGSYTPPLESIQHSSETVIYLGMFVHTWGHVITDCICRLWFLKSELMNQFKNCPLVYVNFINADLILDRQKNFCRLLDILEVDVSRLQKIAQPTQFDKIILPDESFATFSLRGFTNEYREMIEQVRDFALKNRTPIANKKIYYFHGGKQFGEERLAQYFKAKGYEIIRPETLTLDEQLNLMINCESFASTLGSCAHNSIFLKDGTESIFIRRSTNSLGPYQLVLNDVHSLNITYIDSTLSIFKFANLNYCYIISEQLKRFFGDKFDGYEEEDFKIFLRYVKNSMIKGLDVISRKENYYAPIFMKSPVFMKFMAQLKQRKDLIATYEMPPRWETFQPPLTYQTHVHKNGWGVWNREEQISNNIDKLLDIQAIKLNYPGYKVYYSVYFNKEEGWSEEFSNGEQAGMTGKNKPIYGMRVRLDEAGAKEYDIFYRMHKFDGTWTSWAKNDEVIYSHGQKLNAIQIKLEPVKPAEMNITESDYAQSFLTEGNGIYLQDQRQDVTQIKLET